MREYDYDFGPAATVEVVPVVRRAGRVGFARYGGRSNDLTPHSREPRSDEHPRAGGPRLDGLAFKAAEHAGKLTEALLMKGGTGDQVMACYRIGQ